MRAGGRRMHTDLRNDRYLTKAETASYLGISLRWLEQLRRGSNPPPAFKLGQKLLFRVSELDDWIEQYRVNKASRA
jgi:excisionase family DNA binding protein